MKYRQDSTQHTNINLFPAKFPARICLRSVTFLLTFLVVSMGWSHGKQHLDSGISVDVDSAEQGTKFPLEIEWDFELIDHHGKQVTNESYPDRHLLVFFGYINCKSMCSLSLARIGKALTLLGDSVNKLAPLVITVDPERDTPEVMKAALQKFHPQLIGLTGTPDMLKVAYQNYKQNPTALANDENNDPVISHSSYIFLMDKSGKFATLFPPILNPQSMAKIIRKYIDSDRS